MSSSKQRVIVCVGGGGHARVVMDAISLDSVSWNLVGYTDPRAPSGQAPEPFPYLGSDSVLGDLRREGVCWAVLGVGSVGTWTARRKIIDTLRSFDFNWGVIKHPAAFCSHNARLGEGTVMLAHSVVNVGSMLGRHCIVNSGAIVEHDCTLGDWSHVGPGAFLGGGVRVGEGSHIGLGARVREGVVISRNVLVGMGSVVLEDVPEHVTVIGSPARFLRYNDRED